MIVVKINVYQSTNYCLILFNLFLDAPSRMLQKESSLKYFSAAYRYIPVLMAQAKIYWDLENYSQVEKIFRKSVEFCNESDIWKLNVAHVLFMQENKFKEATGFYEPIVKKNYDNVRVIMIC